MKRYDAWSESDPQCNFGGGRCELYERTLGQYVTFDDHERAIAAVIAERDRLAAENAEIKRRLNSIVNYSGRLMKGVGEYENGYNKAMAEIRAVAIAEGQDNRYRPHRPDGLLKD